MTGPLAGLRVIELGGKGPAPFAGMILADMGAEVFACDRPHAEVQSDAAVLGRGKARLRANLKDVGVRDALLGALATIDVIIEGFRPGTVERLGLGPDDAHAVNPALVYGRVTGYGQTGSRAAVPGHDVNFIAMSSALAHIGPPGAPPAVPLNLVGDFGAGGMLLIAGVLAALVERGRSGCGQVVDAAMTDGSAQLMASAYGMRAAGLWSDERGTNVVDGAAPFYRAYETADGSYVSVGALDPRHYAELLRICGIDQRSAPRQDDRSRWRELSGWLEEIFRTRDRAHWVKAFARAETSFAPVLTMVEAPEHPYHRERGTFVSLDGVVQPAPAPRFSRTPSSVASSAGSSTTTADVLARLGVAPDVVRTLLESGEVG